MREQRKQVLRKLKKTPSLSPLLNDPEWGEGAWGDAVTPAIAKRALIPFPKPALGTSLACSPTTGFPPSRSSHKASGYKTYLSARLVNRALPSPVPIVMTPQCSTSRMNGAWLKPCNTASLCITT